jgi:hypothetical protein
VGSKVTYVGRASRVRLEGDLVLYRNQPVEVPGSLAVRLQGNPDYQVQQAVQPPAPAPRTRPRPAPVAPEHVAEPAAAAPANDTESVAAPGTAAPAPVVPDAAEGEPSDG